MPTYQFRHKESNEQIEVFMKMSEKDQWLIDHPEYESVLTQAPLIGDPIRMGVTKPPSDFMKYVIGGVKDKIHGSQIREDRFSIPKEY